MNEGRPCTAFEGSQRVAAGDLPQVALRVKEAVDRGAPILIFDDATSRPIDVDFRGTPADVAQRLETKRGPGRPRLGVVSREVTLLPRHWEWLGSQPGGASVALRKLVDAARRTHGGRDRARQAQEVAYRFMSAMAGNEHGFEEAARALFAGQAERFDEMTASWPPDVREHARGLAEPAFVEGRVP